MVNGSVVLTGLGVADVSSVPPQLEPAVRTSAPNTNGDEPKVAALCPLITWLCTVARKLVLAGIVTFWRQSVNDHQPRFAMCLGVNDLPDRRTAGCFSSGCRPNKSWGGPAAGRAA